MECFIYRARCFSWGGICGLDDITEYMEDQLVGWLVRIANPLGLGKQFGDRDLVLPPITINT